MKNLSLKSVIVFLAFWIVWTFPAIVSAFTLMNNAPEQSAFVMQNNLVLWIIFAITGSIGIILIVRPI